MGVGERVGLWSGFIDFDGIRENVIVLLRSGLRWLVISWCRLMMNFPFIIRKFLYVGSRLWYESWLYFCADLRCDERVEWCEFWWLVWDYWFLFENGLILLGILWFLGGILGWFDGIGGFLGSWKLLEIKDFSKVRRSSSRMIFGYFGWEFGNLRKWSGGWKLSGRCEWNTFPFWQPGRIFWKCKIPGVIRVFENYTLSKSVKYF